MELSKIPSETKGSKLSQEDMSSKQGKESNSYSRNRFVELLAKMHYRCYKLTCIPGIPGKFMEEKSTNSYEIYGSHIFVVKSLEQ